MALILCSECGRKYSDTVAKCPHCGAERDKSSAAAEEDFSGPELITCPECGEMVSAGLKTCPECGFVLEKDELGNSDIPDSAGMVNIANPMP
ncbi:MAG TPA: zinc-ribbon domain-containing protein, partial [Lachnospiraceae bacterium]|nr:zinc-ribbon domain-containing protein [Lachnospiraceae bacterium]